MKYLIACLISFGMISTSLAQSGRDLEELEEEEGEISCFFLDENTIACFQEPIEGDTLEELDPERRQEPERKREEPDTTQVEKRYHWDLDEKYEGEYRQVQTFRNSY